MNPSDPAAHDLEPLLQHLKQARGFDFTGYKRASLARRIEKRMQSINVASYPDYVDYLEVHPEEFTTLFNTILINVTSFFRDLPTWEFVAAEVVPKLVALRTPTAPIRVWSAGCASGEEAYTLAMILAEQLGTEMFRARVKIYATDVDDDALGRARQAVYGEREVAHLPPQLIERYFDHGDRGAFAFRKDLRRQVIFGRHDLIQDAPISRIDLLVCRNTLMYFNAETQARILARFHFALNDGGVLMLGRAETLLSQANTFTPVDLKRRISAKVPRNSLDLRDRLLLMAQNGSDDGPVAPTHLFRLREVALDTAPVAQIVVDAEGTLALANDRARALFGIAPADVGRPLQDLRISYRPVELRSLVEQASLERRPILVRDVDWKLTTGETRWLEVQVVPIVDGGSLLGASVAFSDVTNARRLQREVETTNRELESAYEELQSTNEELETTNEELQSTVEELETTNEELQSTNEELETMNEELQSTNEELTTINDELRQRSDELNRVNDFFESVLTSMHRAVVALDHELRVLVWNAHAEDLWGLRESEVLGRHILSLDVGFPVEQLSAPLKACLTGEHERVEFETRATNRRGRTILCRIGLGPLRTRSSQPRGVILFMDEVPSDDVEVDRAANSRRSSA